MVKRMCKRCYYCTTFKLNSLIFNALYSDMTVMNILKLYQYVLKISLNFMNNCLHNLIFFPYFTQSHIAQWIARLSEY